MRNPNILIVVEDALRADRVGVIGGTEFTPNLDRLANQSAVFTRAFSTTNATDPAITSIQTGRYPLSHGIINHGRRITDKEKRTIQNVPQLPELLSAAGYRTAKFGRPLGRWHRNGFDRYPDNGEWRSAFDKSDLETQISRILGSINPRLQESASKTYEATIQRIIQLMRRSGQNKNGGRTDIIGEIESFISGDDPWFGFVHLMDTHTPYEAETVVIETLLQERKYDNTPLKTVAERFPEDAHSHERLVEGGNIYESIKQWEDTEYGIGTAVVDAQYDAVVKKADDRIGDIYNLLKEKQILDETVLVILSDHGESLTEHGIYYDHHGLYDESVHVPLLIRPPERKSITSDELVQITDVAPTVLSYTDIDGFADVDGHSLRQLIDENEPIDREFVLAEEAHTQRRRMIRGKNKKLIYDIPEENICRYCKIRHAPDEELFLLDDDPGEITNQADATDSTVTKLREKAERLAMTRENQSPEHIESQEVTYEDEDEIHKRLEALGYR